MEVCGATPEEIGQRVWLKKGVEENVKPGGDVEILHMAASGAGARGAIGQSGTTALQRAYGRKWTEFERNHSKTSNPEIIEAFNKPQEVEIEFLEDAVPTKDIAPSKIPDAMGLPNQPLRLASFELEDLHGRRFEELNETARSVMNRLGVPRELRGIKDSGSQAAHTTGEAFTFETAQGGRNTKLGRQSRLQELGQLKVEKRGINVDAAVLDDNFMSTASWKNATIEQRMEAIVAHELAEYKSPGQHFSWRHADAMMQSYRNPNISKQAREIIGSQMRAAVAGGDAKIDPTLLNRIRETLQGSLDRAK